MNKNILKLVTLADIIKRSNTSGSGWDYTIKENQFEMFAELIIKECVDTIMNDTDRHRKEYFAGLLKEHFGVEE